MQAVLTAPNKKLSPSQWNHYAVDIATPDAQQQQIIDKGFCKYFNSKGKDDAVSGRTLPRNTEKMENVPKQ